MDRPDDTLRHFVCFYYLFYINISMKTLLNIVLVSFFYVLLVGPNTLTASELVHGFSNPSFSGSGYSSHVLSIEQLQHNREKENREKESWVQTALGNIHHPLRQDSATKHLKVILEELEAIQLTGDIFFPKGWLASSIGNYASKEAAVVLQSFLDTHPNYNPILLKKILQTTDNLTRAQNIKK